MKVIYAAPMLFSILCFSIFSTCTKYESSIVDISELSGNYLCEIGYYQEDSSGIHGEERIYNVKLEVLETGDRKYLLKVGSFVLRSKPDSIITIPHLNIQLNHLYQAEAMFTVLENGCYTGVWDGNRFTVLGEHSSPSISMQIKCTKPDNIFHLHIGGRKT